MRIKTLFSIPDGEKVTEKALRKVLISSICSILLCMTCLVSTTWAWFAVSIDNKENIIQVAQWRLEVTVTPTAALTETEEETPPVQPEDGVYTLEKGVYDIDIRFFSDARGNDLDQAKVYLIMVEKVGQTETKYVTTFSLDENGAYKPIQKTYEVGKGEQVMLSFYFTRVNPQISNELRIAVFEAEEEATTESTEETMPKTTEPADPSESTDPTEPPAGVETDPAAGSSDDVTATTKPSTEPTTESTTEATTDTVSTDPSSEPTNEAIEPETTASIEETTSTTEGES